MQHGRFFKFKRTQLFISIIYTFIHFTIYFFSAQQQIKFFVDPLFHMRSFRFAHSREYCFNLILKFLLTFWLRSALIDLDFNFLYIFYQDFKFSRIWTRRFWCELNYKLINLERSWLISSFCLSIPAFGLAWILLSNHIMKIFAKEFCIAHSIFWKKWLEG